MSADYMLQHFKYAHLPERLQAISKPFCDLAEWVAAVLPSNPERTIALRKLLEAKDAGVRALLVGDMKIRVEVVPEPAP